MIKPPFLIALLALALAAGGAALPAPAAADMTDRIIEDCNSSVTGELTGRYTRKQLNDALGGVDGDVAEYSGCYDAIRSALRGLRRPAGDDANEGGGNGVDDGGLGSGDGGSGDLGGGTPGDVGGTPGTTGSANGGGAAQTPAAPVAPVPQQPGSAAPVRVSGAAVVPSVQATLDRGDRELPSALIAFLVLFAAGAVGIAATTLGRRVLARRRA